MSITSFLFLSAIFLFLSLARWFHCCLWVRSSTLSFSFSFFHFRVASQQLKKIQRKQQQLQQQTGSGGNGASDSGINVNNCISEKGSNSIGANGANGVSGGGGVGGNGASNSITNSGGKLSPYSRIGGNSQSAGHLTDSSADSPGFSVGAMTYLNHSPDGKGDRFLFLSHYWYLLLLFFYSYLYVITSWLTSTTNSSTSSPPLLLVQHLIRITYTNHHHFFTLCTHTHSLSFFSSLRTHLQHDFILSLESLAFSLSFFFSSLLWLASLSPINNQLALDHRYAYLIILRPLTLEPSSLLCRFLLFATRCRRLLERRPHYRQWDQFRWSWRCSRRSSGKFIYHG